MSSISLPFAQACYNSITLTDFKYQGQGLPALVSVLYSDGNPFRLWLTLDPTLCANLPISATFTSTYGDPTVTCTSATFPDASSSLYYMTCSTAANSFYSDYNLDLVINGESFTSSQTYTNFGTSNGDLCFRTLPKTLDAVTPDGYYPTTDTDPLTFTWSYSTYGCGQSNPWKAYSIIQTAGYGFKNGPLYSEYVQSFPAWSYANDVAPYTALSEFTVSSEEFSPPYSLGSLPDGEYQLKWGPDTYEQTGGVVYWQMNHTTPDSLQRRDRRRRWQEAVEEARPVTPQEIFKTTGKKLECPREGMVACPGSRLGSYQCMDVLNDIDSCGGCPGSGRSCSETDGALDVACVQGKCVVSRCQDEWAVASNATMCVAV